MAHFGNHVKETAFVLNTLFRDGNLWYPLIPSVYPQKDDTDLR